MQRVVGRHRTEVVDRLAAASSTGGPRPGEAPESRADAPGRAPRTFGRGLERHAQRGEPGSAELVDHARTGGLPVGEKAPNDAIGCIVFAVGQRRDVVAQPFAQHLDVAHLAELAAEPAQLRAQLVRPLRVDEVVERPQVGAQPPGRDARLVHGFGILAAANGRFVCVEPVDRAARARR